MPVWLLPVQRMVRGEYEVRGESGAAKSLLDQRVSGRLAALGLSVTGESVEEWGGTVLTRRYEGRCETAEAAAAAGRVLCEGLGQAINPGGQGGPAPQGGTTPNG